MAREPPVGSRSSEPLSSWRISHSTSMHSASFHCQTPLGVAPGQSVAQPAPPPALTARDNRPFSDRWCYTVEGLLHRLGHHWCTTDKYSCASSLRPVAPRRKQPPIFISTLLLRHSLPCASLPPSPVQRWQRHLPHGHLHALLLRGARAAAAPSRGHERAGHGQLEGEEAWGEERGEKGGEDVQGGRGRTRGELLRGRKKERRGDEGKRRVCGMGVSFKL